MPRGRRAAAVAARGTGRRRGKLGNAASGSGNERITRSSKAKLTNGLEDPAQVEKELNAQLQSMGLYAANTIGDGNCLFRALSDQLYGFPTNHAELRENVCDYIHAHAERFAGFIDVEKPFEDYVRTMRQNGTYGGHLELSAFAQLMQKEIKIVQPGLVYVISAGGDEDSPQTIRERERKERERERAQAKSAPGSEAPLLTQRALRKLRRDRKAVGTQPNATESEAGPSKLPSPNAAPAPADDAQSTESIEEIEKQTALASTSQLPASQSSVQTFQTPLQPQPSMTTEPPQQLEAYGPLWIAYHSWEHYSSIRNKEGPHSGLPRVKEQTPGRQHGSANKAAPVEEEDDLQPTVEEELVLQSTRGYSLQQVRFYIARHGGWEEALEAILAQEAVVDEEDEDDEGALPDLVQEDETSVAARSSSPSQLDSSQSTLHPITDHTSHDLHRNTVIPVRLREWRNASPSSVDTNGTHSSVDDASTSTHATTDDALEAVHDLSTKPVRSDTRRSKRTASKDLPMAGLRHPKRRSRSCSPLSQSFSPEQSNDVEGSDAARAIASISVKSDGSDSRLGSEEITGAPPTPMHGNDVDALVDPDKTPRQRIPPSMSASHGTSDQLARAARTLNVRERREMRKADKVRKALGTRAKRQQELDLRQRRGKADNDGYEDVYDDENRVSSLHANTGSYARSTIGVYKGHGADVKGFLELKI